MMAFDALYDSRCCVTFLNLWRCEVLKRFWFSIILVLL